MRQATILRVTLVITTLVLAVSWPDYVPAQDATDPSVGRLFFHEGITLERLWNGATGTWYVPARSERFRELGEEAEDTEELEQGEEVSDEEETFFIAVVDSGVLTNHPGLQGRIADQKDFTGEGIEDRTGHGTYVALALAQASPPEIKLLIAKVAAADGSVRKDAFIKALQWAAERGASIVYAYVGFQGDTAAHHDLCETIEKLHDLTIFAAAGTLGPDADVFPAHCGGHNIIPVGCADADGKPMPSSGRAVIYGRCDVRLEPLTSD